MSGRSIRLIDKDELLATLEQDIDVTVTGADNTEAVKRCLQEILDDVRNSPEIDPVRHGKWELKDSGFHHCSVCGGTPSAYARVYIPVEGFRYCTNCGARMDEDEID